MQIGWFHHTEEKEPDMYVLSHCTNYRNELNTYSWNEEKDNEPEDGNDHMVNAVQYGFLPYKDKIGVTTR